MLDSFFNKVADTKNLTQVFSCKICEIFKNTYFKEHLRLTIRKPLLHEVWGIPRSLEHLDRASFYFIEVKGKMEKHNTRNVDQMRISKNLIWKHSFLRNWKLFPGELRKKNPKTKMRDTMFDLKFDTACFTEDSEGFSLTLSKISALERKNQSEYWETLQEIQAATLKHT